MPTRRTLLKAGGLALAGLALPAVGRAARDEGAAEIVMRSDADGAHVWFDPIGVLLQPGRTVRWVVGANVHTTTAYHPENDNHALRIPEDAAPWSSGYLVDPGASFAVTLTVPGVYDYYCVPHEAAGMVGRIVVGHAAGPAALSFETYRERYADKGWEPVPPAARSAFPAVEAILRQGVVRRPSPG